MTPVERIRIIRLTERYFEQSELFHELGVVVQINMKDTEHAIRHGDE